MGQFRTEMALQYAWDRITCMVSFSSFHFYQKIHYASKNYPFYSLKLNMSYISMQAFHFQG